MRSKLMLAVVGAAVLSIGVSGIAAAADTVAGQHGNYIFTDYNITDQYGATCKHSAGPGIGVWDLYKIVGRAPSVWWMDTNSSITTQHGSVGWQLIVLHKTPAASKWTLLKKTTIQRKTAYEDQLSTYDPARKAPFTNLSVSITASNYPTTEQFLARVKVFWFRSDGTVRGYAVHDVQYYKWLAGSSLAGINPYCLRRFLE